MEIPESEARELALIYGDLEEAIRALGHARAVHRGTGPSALVNRLAITEAAAIGRSSSEHAVAAVVEIRKGARLIQGLGSQVVEEARKIDLRQDTFQREFRDWRESFTTFLNSLDSLFTKTERRLHVIGLEPQDLANALKETEGILSRAIERCYPGGEGE